MPWVTCDPDYMGIYLMVLNKKDEVQFDQKVGLNYNDSVPETAWVNDHLLMSWRTENNLYVKKYQSGSVVDINTFANLNTLLTGNKIVKLNDNQVMIYWTDIDTINDQPFTYYIIYDALQSSHTAPALLETNNTYPGPIIEVTPLSGNKTAVMSCDYTFSTNAKREIHIFDLNTQTKVVSQKHTEMLNSHPFINNPYDSVCPKLGSINDELFTVFKRGTTTDVLRYDLMLNKGVIGSTCQ